MNAQSQQECAYSACECIVGSKEKYRGEYCADVTTPTKLKFNVTASTLRVLSPEVENTHRIREELTFAGFSCRDDKRG